MTMRNILFVIAACLIVVGVAFVYWPAALVAAGLSVGAGAYLSDE